MHIDTIDTAGPARVHRRVRHAVAVAAIALLAACGGGGGSSGTTPLGGGGGTPPVSSTAAFDVRSGYHARVEAGATDNYTVTGSCAGSATIVNGAPTDVTFEGGPARAATQTATVTFTNCTPSTSTASGSNYFDANEALLGTRVVDPVTHADIEYARWAAGTTPAALPSAAHVGDSGALTTLTTYADASKAMVTGRRDYTYAIEADTATTAILNLTVKTYDASSTLLITQQSRYRVAADGSLTVLTIDVQYSGTSNAHLVYTKA